MKKLPFVAVFVFALCISSFAQTNSDSPCPAISVVGPAGISELGVPWVFVANVENKNMPLTYLWSVSGGIIVGGQGTLNLKVRPNGYNINVTASVRIGGLSSGCLNFASESAQVICDPYLVIGDVSFWGQYHEATWDQEREELDSLILKGLKKHPNRIAYIEKTFRNDISWKAREAHVRKIKNYVYNVLRIPKKKFVIKHSLGDRDRSNTYLVPPDAPVLKPNYSDC